MTGELNVPRIGHTATLLTNGFVLLAGGTPTNALVFNTTSVELYNPVEGTWALTNSLHSGRYSHTATMLANGMVYVAGGTGGTNLASIAPLSSAELFNPATGAWTETNLLKSARTEHTATFGGGSDLWPGRSLFFVFNAVMAVSV